MIFRRFSSMNQSDDDYYGCVAKGAAVNCLDSCLFYLKIFIVVKCSCTVMFKNTHFSAIRATTEVVSQFGDHVLLKFELLSAGGTMVIHEIRTPAHDYFLSPRI